jgi:hypothetical protein
MFLSQRSLALEPYEGADLYEAWQYDIFTTLAGYHLDGLSGLQDQLFSDVPLDDVQFTLGTLHADPEVVHDIVESLGESHPKC